MESNPDARQLLKQILLTSHQNTPDQQSRLGTGVSPIQTPRATSATGVVYVFLVFLPLVIVAGTTHLSPTVVFVVNFVAAIPITFALNHAAESVSTRLNSTVRGLCNATLGNTWDIIIGISALASNELRLAQLCMFGSIMMNLLVVSGCCFSFGGINHHEQSFNPTVASTRSSLISVVSASLIIVALVYGTSSKPLDAQSAVLVVSRGISIVLLLLYTMYLVFRLRTHSHLFITETDRSGRNQDVGTQKLLSPALGYLTILLSVATLCFCANNLISSTAGFVQDVHISKTIVVLIILPAVGNICKQATAVTAAVKSRAELAIAISIGSSLQTAMFVTPLLVILSWLAHRPMTLYFGKFETVAFSVSNFVVNLLVQDGKSNFLEGALCLALYIIITLAIFLLPGEASHPL